MDKDIQINTGANNADLASLAEAFLFTEGEPMARSRLQKILGCTDEQLRLALMELSKRQEGGGIILIQTEKELSLAVSASCSPAIRAESAREHEREIGDAGLEVLSILLYRGPSTRSQIDYIRGVNTSTTLRTLLSRGLVLRSENPSDSREYLYSPTAELFAHLGAADKQSLPEYLKITGELAAFEANKEQGEIQ